MLINPATLKKREINFSKFYLAFIPPVSRGCDDLCTDRESAQQPLHKLKAY
jgi:hypothetical protein